MSIITQIMQEINEMMADLYNQVYRSQTKVPPMNHKSPDQMPPQSSGSH